MAASDAHQLAWWMELLVGAAYCGWQESHFVWERMEQSYWQMHWVLVEPFLLEVSVEQL